MKSMRRIAVSVVAIVVMLGLSGCSGMSTRDRNTAIGAGAGAVGGAVLTGGSALGTVGGAAVGGVIGNQVGDDKK
ncbi:MAG: osmotically-inducible lipoprotein OsmB [Burkholderiales bacterium]|nr:osmotically-inducible lipoprotein OsmB [Nitrosomonas sp.]MCP5245403.1 osmotically-inducible lipoprotein OsmB [Burkholderiales bacterium]